MTKTLVFAAKRLIGSLKHVISMGSSLIYGLGYISAAALKRAVLSFKSGSKTVEDILDGAIDTTTGTGNVKKNYTKRGGYQAGLDDFNSLGLKNVKESSNGALVGQLDDGTYVNYRFSDKNGWSLEIQYGSRNKVKIRYE